MTRLTVRSRVGSDGILRVDVPIGADEADAEMNVTIEPVAKKPLGEPEFAAFIDSLAGAWQGEFQRPEQGPPEDAEVFSSSLDPR